MRKWNWQFYFKLQLLTSASTNLVFSNGSWLAPHLDKTRMLKQWVGGFLCDIYRPFLEVPPATQSYRPLWRCVNDVGRHFHRFGHPPLLVTVTPSQLISLLSGNAHPPPSPLPDVICTWPLPPASFSVVWQCRQRFTLLALLPAFFLVRLGIIRLQESRPILASTTGKKSLMH